MPLDLSAEVVAALRSPEGRALLYEIMTEASEEGARRALAKQGESLETLASIFGCSPAAARMRAKRDPELAALGMRVGQRAVLYRRSEVMALWANRQRTQRGANPLRLVRDE